MTINALAHYSVRTSDLEGSRRFYADILDLKTGFRPPFPFPGHWLYPSDTTTGCGVVHLIGTAPGGDAAVRSYLGERQHASTGSGAFDHVAFHASDWPSLKKRCERHNLDYAERVVPLLGLRQVFVSDPSGVTIELNYPAADT